MKKFLSVFLLLFSFGLMAQVTTLECLSCQTENTLNCVNCSFEQTSKILNGIKVLQKGKKEVILTHPIKTVIVGNRITLKDAFATEVNLTLTQIVTYNTSAKILDFIKECSCYQAPTIISSDPNNDIIAGSDGGAFFQETNTSLNYNAITHSLIYIDENGSNNSIPLDVAVLSYNSSTNQITYTDEKGVVTTFDLQDDTDVNNNITVVNDSLRIDLVNVITGNILSTTYIDNVINKPHFPSTFAQDPSTGDITHSNGYGVTSTAKILSSDAGNDLMIGTDGGLIYDSPISTLNKFGNDALSTVPIGGFYLSSSENTLDLPEGVLLVKGTNNNTRKMTEAELTSYLLTLNFTDDVTGGANGYKYSKKGMTIECIDCIANDSSTSGVTVKLYPNAALSAWVAKKLW